MARPNFVLILTDDMGSGDLPCVPGGDPAVVCGGTASFGHPYAHMPHLAALQRDGARFTAAYTLGLTCSPSRNAWLTGRMPAELNVGLAGLPHPPVSETAVPVAAIPAHAQRPSPEKLPPHGPQVSEMLRAVAPAALRSRTLLVSCLVLLVVPLAVALLAASARAWLVDEEEAQWESAAAAAEGWMHPHREAAGQALQWLRGAKY